MKFKHRFPILALIIVSGLSSCSKSVDDYCKCFEEAYTSPKEYQNALDKCQSIGDEVLENLGDDEKAIEEAKEKMDECSFGKHLKNQAG